MADEGQTFRRHLMENALRNGHRVMGISKTLMTALAIVGDLPGVPPDGICGALSLLIANNESLAYPEEISVPVVTTSVPWTPELVAGLAVGLSIVMNRATDLAVEEEDEEDESPGILGD